MIDATIVRVHQHATFVIKKVTQSEQGIGKSRGGRTTKIHAVVDALGLPIDLHITEGNCHDISQAERLLSGKESENVIADKGYDSNSLRDIIRDSGRSIVIPGRSCRREEIIYDKHLYKERHLIENFFGRIKHYRRVATRYEAKIEFYRAMVVLACVLVWLQF